MPEPQESNPEDKPQPKSTHRLLKRSKKVKESHLNAKERRELRLKQRASMLESRHKANSAKKKKKKTGKASSNGFNNKEVKSCVHNQGKTGRKVGSG